MKHDAIAVIDFGGQYAHLIATKIRRLRVLAEIRQPEDATDAFRRYKGIIISGSPSLASHGEGSDYNREIYDLDVPILGFCFGHQEIAKHYGGTVVHGASEWGPADLQVVGDSPLFKGLAAVERVFMSHFDSVTSVGPGFEEIGFATLGTSGASHRFAAIASDSLRRYGFQFPVGMYDDGQPGEIFLVMAKEGSAISGLMDSFATAISLALQYGVPLKVLLDKFSHTRFEPSGHTGNSEVPYAKSIDDYIFRWLASKFLPREEQVQAGVHVTDKPLSSTVQIVSVKPAGTPQMNDLKSMYALDDAPTCAGCGSIMVRNGSCYKCENCGSTSGCS